MNIRMLAAAAAVALPMAMAGVANAADSGVTYTGELGYTRAEFQDSTPSVGLNTIHGRVGAQFNQNWGVEAEAATSLGSDKEKVGAVNVSFKMNYLVGAFVVGSLPVNENTSVFARVGVASAELEGKGPGGTASDSESGWGVGAGVKWFPNGGANGLRVEYTRYDFDGDGVNAFGVGYVRKF